MRPGVEYTRPVTAKTAVAFGYFDLGGGRYWAIRTGLEAHGYRVSVCHTTARGLVPKCRDLLRQWKAVGAEADLVYVPFMGHWILPLAWFLARRRRIPVVFDLFLSLYESDVRDRGILRPWHPKAWALWILDWLGCRLCDVALIDTEEYARYFAETYGADPGKILPLPIGCRTDLFVPGDRPANPVFTVEFHGTFIPLQGIDTVLRAAKILEDRGEEMRFLLIGKGQTYPAMVELARRLGLRSVEFTGQIPMEEVARRVGAADACLGIFGTTEKALRVIPHKAYEVLNAGRPLVTALSPASARVLRRDRDALLTEPGDPAALADALTRLKRDPALREALGISGRKLSLEKFQPREIVYPLVTRIDGAMRRRNPVP